MNRRPLYCPGAGIDIIKTGAGIDRAGRQQAVEVAAVRCPLLDIPFVEQSADGRLVVLRPGADRKGAGQRCQREREKYPDAGHAFLRAQGYIEASRRPQFHRLN